MDRTTPAPSRAAGAPDDPRGTPRVSVIVTAYGVAGLLGEALVSLQAQTMTDWECIVIDDGAPDDVAGAVAPFLADPRVRFMATDNAGVSTARNRAVAVARTPLVAILDGDDLYRPGYLASTVPVLEQDDSIRLVTCNALIFGAVTEERTCVTAKQGTGDGVRGTLSDVLDRSFNVYIGTTFRRADFEAIGGFDTALTHSEDFDLWVRLMQLGGDAWYVDEVLGDYRVRPNSASSQTERMLAGIIAVYAKTRAVLPAGAPEIDLLDQLIAERRRDLELEQAISRIIDGDTRDGLDELRRTGGPLFGNPLWRAALTLWRFAPGLAPAMLDWRRRRSARGYTGPSLQPLRAIRGRRVAGSAPA